MRRIACSGFAIVLLGSFAGLAHAQNSPPQGITPPPPLSQPQAPIADQAAPAAVGPAQAGTSGTSSVGQTPLGATGQTMPSTISKANATLDKLPTTALQFPLTSEQKQLIVKSVDAAPKTADPSELASIHVAMFLPIGVPMAAFSGDVTRQIPEAGRFKYVKLGDRILIVDPPFLTVVGEIKL